MKILIVYDSYFGNTEQVALALKKSFKDDDSVDIQRISQVTTDSLTRADLIIVGSPTRKFSATPAIKSFLKKLPEKSLDGIKTAAFDTRIDILEINNRFLTFMVKLFGYAAEPLDALLRKKGGKPVLPPEGFIVKDTEGPLKEGELDRAVSWAQQALR